MAVAREIAGPAEEELSLTASAKDAMVARSLGPQALNGLLAKACAAAAAEQHAVPQLAKQCAKCCACMNLHAFVWMRSLEALHHNMPMWPAVHALTSISHD